MIEEWQPAENTGVTPDCAPLQRLLEATPELEATDEAGLAALTLETARYDQADLDSLKRWTQLDEQAWQAVWPDLGEQASWQLAVWLVLAEQQLSGFHCGDHNPAIWAFRWLRQRNATPAKPLIKAVKARTDNRFIPYGSVL